MALDDDLAAVERTLLDTPTGAWLAAIDDLKRTVLIGGTVPPASVLALVPPDIAAHLTAAMIAAYAIGAGTALEALETAADNLLDITEEGLTQASVAANAKPPKSLDINKNASWLAGDAAEALAKAKALLLGGVPQDQAMAPLFAHANRMRYGIVTGVTDAGNAGVAAVAEAVDLPQVWVAERNACVRCLAHQGHVIVPGGKFPAGLTFGSRQVDDAVRRPPLHGHCRCHLEILYSPSYAEALRREAERSVLRGYSLESEPMGERIHAANKLLNDPDLVAPATVKKYARQAVKAGQFPTRDPYAAPPDPPRPAAQGKPAPKSSSKPKTEPGKPKPPRAPKFKRPPKPRQ